MGSLPELTDSAARWLFLAVWLPFAAMRLYYHRRAGASQRRWYTKEEGIGFAVFRIFFALPWFLALSAWLVQPRILAFARFDLPAGLRWLGTVLLVAGASWVFWVNRTLGQNFSGTLSLRDDHRLVKIGPYRWMRHPMYPGFLVIAAGMLLLSANWLLGVPVLLGVILVMVVRTPREERMLLERFGDEYRRYRARTGRFLPRLRPAGR